MSFGFASKSLIAPSGSGTGTVTDLSVVSANGLAGSVASSTTTPAITLSTSITGILKGNGTAISAATANTDYISPSGIAKGGLISGSGAGTVGITVVGTDGQVLSADAASTNGIKWVTGGGGAGLTANSFTGLQTITLTTAQLKLAYDGSNYNTFTVSSAGSLTIAATGTNPDIALTPGGTGSVKISSNDLRIGSGVNADHGIYLGYAGYETSILWLASGNLQITPRTSYGVVFVGGAGVGNVAVGTQTGAMTAKLQAESGTEQLRLLYNSTNYNSFTVGSTGSLTIAALSGGADASITLTPKGAGIVSTGGTFKAGGYQSSDGTAGATAGPFTALTGITVKNGLVTALTGS